MASEIIKHESLSERESQLKSVAVTGQLDGGDFFAGSATIILSEAMTYQKRRSLALKVTHFREQKIECFQKHLCVADPHIAGSASLNPKHEIQVPVRGRKAEQLGTNIAKGQHGAELFNRFENVIAGGRNVPQNDIDVWKHGSHVR